MKKIYSKITKERRKQFQIETCIMKDGEQRLVVKRALAKDGVALMGPGYFTKKGHFIVLVAIDDNDQVTVADVGSRHKQ